MPHLIDSQKFFLYLFFNEVSDPYRLLLQLCSQRFIIHFQQSNVLMQCLNF